MNGRGLAVVAVGGNALAPPSGAGGAPTSQRARLATLMAALATVADHRALVLTHGNGPQVGQLALDQLRAGRGDPDPLDVLDAATEGTLGYAVELAARNAVHPRPVVSVLTMVEVAADDPAFAHPTKPVGPVYTDADPGGLASRHGWTMAPVRGGYRRVVASPAPRRVVEHDAIASLVHQGFVVVCGGGGGIPVVRERDRWYGVEAVIDKDLTSALLAERLGARALYLLTDVAGVLDGFGTPDATPVPELTAAEARALGLPAGSMGTKVDAAVRFVRATGGVCRIGALDAAADVFAGRAGTLLRP